MNTPNNRTRNRRLGITLFLVFVVLVIVATVAIIRGG